MDISQRKLKVRSRKGTGAYERGQRENRRFRSGNNMGRGLLLWVGKLVDGAAIRPRGWHTGEDGVIGAIEELQQRQTMHGTHEGDLAVVAMASLQLKNDAIRYVAGKSTVGDDLPSLLTTWSDGLRGLITTSSDTPSPISSISGSGDCEWTSVTCRNVASYGESASCCRGILLGSR